MSPSEEPTAHGVSDTTQSSNNHARSTSTSQPASSTPQTGPVYEQDDEQEQHAPDPRGKTRASALIDSAEAPTTEGPVSRANPMPQAATEAYAVTVAVAVAPPEPPNDKPVLAPCHLADSEAADAMASSVTTIKAPTPTSHHEHAAHHLAAVQPSYVDPTPATPMISQPPSRSPSSAARSHRSGDPSPSRSDVEEDKSYASEDEQDGGSRSEIQSIMEQFSEEGGGPGADEVMSPRLEIASPMFAAPVQHPPRKSSLEPSSQSLSKQVSEFSSLRVATSSPSSERGDRSNERGLQDQGPPVPPKDSVFANRPRSTEDGHPPSVTSLPSPQLAKHRPPPPEPEPEPSLPFDFHRFLEQLRNKKADPVARYLKSFLSEFGKKQWMVHEQVKIIGDFLAFIANKMVLCDVWKDVSDAEFDNAREGMEKLVMNRLYAQTFSPAIPCPKPIPGAKPKRRGADASLGPGRRGQHQEDVERDEILTQKINIYGWVKLEHLDVPAVGDSGRRFLKLAQQELLKIKSYRAPRDKIICVLNCSKVIFGLLKHNKSDSSADSFMPLLIYVVLQCNPEHLVSNVQYILRFRNQEKLGGEAGYYLSSLMGAVQFIENMDRSSLTISDDEFEKNVEAAVSAIAEKHQTASPDHQHQTVFSEKTGLHFPGEPSARRRSTDAAEGSTPRRATSPYEGESQDGAAITGLLRTIQKPLSTIGRMFSDEANPLSSAAASAPRSQGFQDRQLPRPPYLDAPPSPRVLLPPPPPPPPPQQQQQSSSETLARRALPAEEAAARQASAEAAEARRLHRAEHTNVVETLAGMFPDLDRDVISDVVYQKQGRVGLAVDACLALSS